MAWASFNRQMFNPSIIKHNHFDAHIATAKNCGTHWIKYMLSHVLAEIHGLPEPKNIRDNSIVGHPKHKPIHTDIPQIVATHSQPHYLMRHAILTDILNTPKCVFIVRDPKDLLVSLYEKWKDSPRVAEKHKGRVSFSQYLHTDISERGFVENIWGIIRFYNAWGAAQKSNPDHIMMIRYEDLKANTQKQLSTLCDFIDVKDTTPDIIASAIQKSSKQEMRNNLSKDAPQYDKIVNVKERNSSDWYADKDKEFLQMLFKRYLKYDFGYIKEHT